jgi:hypothetical protein
MAEWVLAVERAYVAAATGTASPAAKPTSDPADLPRARAAAAAVASRFLAVGTPRSMSFAIDVGAEIDAAVLALEAHRTWFAPLDIRCARSAPGADELAAKLGGRVVSLDEAFAADIVNIHGAYCHVHAKQLRRGTHVNVLTAPYVIDDDVHATRYDEPHDLPALAAGLVDGRQLDELTVFVAGDAAIALAALAQRP